MHAHSCRCCRIHCASSTSSLCANSRVQLAKTTERSESAEFITKVALPCDQCVILLANSRTGYTWSGVAFRTCTDIVCEEMLPPSFFVPTMGDVPLLSKCVKVAVRDSLNGVRCGGDRTAGTICTGVEHVGRTRSGDATRIR